MAEPRVDQQGPEPSAHDAVSSKPPSWFMNVWVLVVLAVILYGFVAAYRYVNSPEMEQMKVDRAWCVTHNPLGVDPGLPDDLVERFCDRWARDRNGMSTTTLWGERNRGGFGGFDEDDMQDPDCVSYRC